MAQHSNWYNSIMYDVVVYLSSLPRIADRERKAQTLRAFAAGAAAQGARVLVQTRNEVVDCRLAVIMAWVGTTISGPHIQLRKDVIAHQHKQGQHVMPIDGSCFKFADPASQFLRYSLDGVFYNTNNYANTKWPVIFSGITTMAPIQQARRHGLDYWYVDSGYFGNNKRKTYLRVCKNSIHASGDIVSRPRDRLDQLQLSATTGVDTAPIPRGRQILVVPPDAKQCVHFGIHSAEQWLTQTVSAIQQFTQRPIVIRTRPVSSGI